MQHYRLLSKPALSISPVARDPEPRAVQFIILYYQNGQPLNARAHGAVCLRERNPERRVSGSARYRVIERSHYWCPKLAAAQAPNPDTEPPARERVQITSTRCRVLLRAESGTASERECAASWIERSNYWFPRLTAANIPLWCCL